MATVGLSIFIVSLWSVTALPSGASPTEIAAAVDPAHIRSNTPADITAAPPDTAAQADTGMSHNMTPSDHGESGMMDLAPGESPDGLPGATGPTLPAPSPTSTVPLPAGPVIADPAAVGIGGPSSDIRAIVLIIAVTVTPVATLATAAWLGQRRPEHR